ncbi:MAG: XdhC family protein [Candidatus Krumholzibacteria bacterium]|nr:XdhC family protein [Candidatus Krumholzibacteria bacterium]
MKNNHRLTVDEGDIYRRLTEMVEQGQRGVLATVIRTHQSTPRHEGSKMIILTDGSVVGSVGGGAAEARVIEEARQVLLDGRPRCLPLDLVGDVGVCGGHMEIFLEPVTGADPFIVIGAGHVGRALVELGRALPFRFTLIDDRPGLVSDLEGLPGVNLLEASPADLMTSVEVPVRGALLIASRNHELDGDYLEAVINAEHAAGREFAFLGALASRTKAAMLRKRFSGEDWRRERIARMQYPVGLDIGAETPSEIALSVLAEALAVIREVPQIMDDDGLPLGVRLHRRRQ